MSRLKICQKCGKTFRTSTGNSSAYLCPDCALQSKRDSVYRERICKTCGTSFMGYPHSFYCPICKAERKKQQKRQYNTQPSARPLGSTDICELCGKEYTVKSGLQKYCPDCAESAINNKIRARKRKYAADNKELFDARKEKTRGKGYVCVICGKVFEKESNTVTCSPECEAELRRITQNKVLIKKGKRHLPAESRYESGLPKSGVPGVTWRKNGKWQAMHKGRYIGVYDTIEAASEAIEQYKIKNKSQ